MIGFIDSLKVQKSRVNLTWCPDLTSAAQPDWRCTGWDGPVASRDQEQKDSSIGHWFSERPWPANGLHVSPESGREDGAAVSPPTSLSTPLIPQTSVRVPTARLGALTHTRARPGQRTEALVLKSSSSALRTRQAKSLWKRLDTSSYFLSGSQVALTHRQHLGLVLSTWNRAHKIHSWMNDARLRRAAVSADLGTGMSATGAMSRPPPPPYLHDSEGGVCEVLLFQRFLSRPHRPRGGGCSSRQSSHTFAAHRPQAWRRRFSLLFDGLLPI